MPEKKASEKRKKEFWLDSYEVRSNGFLRPRIDPDALGTDDSPAIKAKSFSAIGNAAATPGKAKAIQERQLISGRDFRDILEACRPRVSGMTISSSLASLLQISQKDVASKPIIPLHEWGTVDIVEFAMQAKPKSVKSDSPSTHRSPRYGALLDKSEGDSETGSASSYASHVSSALGIGYDRILWDQFSTYSPGAGAKKTVQLQRSLSLDFDEGRTTFPSTDSDAGFSEDSLSLATSNASRSSATGRNSNGGEGDTESVTDNDGASDSFLSESGKRMQNLRRLMEAHDAKACAPVGSDKGKVKENNVVSARETDFLNASRHRGKEVQLGGLGEALSSYDRKGPQQDNSRDIRITRRSSFQHERHERNRVSSPLFPGMSLISESGTRSISPILLPPIIQSHTTDQVDNTRTDGTSQGQMQTSIPIEYKSFVPREGFSGSADTLPQVSHSSELAVSPLYPLVSYPNFFPDNLLLLFLSD